MTPQSDVSLAPLCTMRVGGPARWLVEAHDATTVRDAFRWAASRGVSIHILGGGSNVVVADAGFDGLVIHVKIRGIEETPAGGRVVYRVGAGESWDGFVAAAVASNAAGVECLSGIPGLVGGTPVQNVGAYGQDVSATITRIDAIDRNTDATVSLSNAECGFGYRSSRFKREDADRFVVTHVEFTLTPDGPPTITYADVVRRFEQRASSAGVVELREAILEIRRAKGMVIEGSDPIRSCGSFFLNPVVPLEHYARVQAAMGSDVPKYPVGADQVKIPAAWLIEHAGFRKGTERGAVGISPFQAQAIINRGGACAGDVVALAGEVKRAVWTAFAVSLVPEPVFVGFPSSDELRWLCRHL